MKPFEIVEFLALCLLMLNFLAFLFMLLLSVEFGFEFDFGKILAAISVLSMLVVYAVIFYKGCEDWY